MELELVRCNFVADSATHVSRHFQLRGEGDELLVRLGQEDADALVVTVVNGGGVRDLGHFRRLMNWLGRGSSPLSE